MLQVRNVVDEDTPLAEQGRRGADTQAPPTLAKDVACQGGLLPGRARTRADDPNRDVPEMKIVHGIPGNRKLKGRVAVIDKGVHLANELPCRALHTRQAAGQEQAVDDDLAGRCNCQINPASPIARRT